MATKIRLKKFGKIREPHYRVVVMDSRKKRDGRAIEVIGQYHPKSDPSVIKIDSERVQYWLGVGAQPTEAIVAILKRTGDWQTFTGDDSIPSGVTEQPAKADKLAAFNAALAEADGEPTASAISTKKSKDQTEDTPAAAPGTTEADSAGAEA
ncbi:30S ribosomal protein S16 [Propionibacterium sp.]|uniref:30S ribosomal protein S16 n=1 Tax=Propionibacterium sp. TaxID=1977903 RepID=UPI0039EAE865